MNGHTSGVSFKDSSCPSCTPQQRAPPEKELLCTFRLSGHSRISSTGSKVRTTLDNLINSTTGKYLSSFHLNCHQRFHPPTQKLEQHCMTHCSGNCGALWLKGSEFSREMNYHSAGRIRGHKIWLGLLLRQRQLNSDTGTRAVCFVTVLKNHVRRKTNLINNALRRKYQDELRCTVKLDTSISIINSRWKRHSKFFKI